MYRKRRMIFRKVVPYRRNIGRQRGLDKLFVRRQTRSHPVYDRQQIILRLQMIHPVHHQQIRRRRQRCKPFFKLPQPKKRFVGICGQSLQIVIPKRHENSQHMRAIRPLPDKFCRMAAVHPFARSVTVPVGYAAAEHKAVDAESAQDLRKL